MILLSKNDFDEFRAWLGLNMDGITWQGRYKEEFEFFWENFFSPEVQLFEILKRFEYAKKELKIGPLLSWFNWLKNKFIAFIYITKNISILELSNQTGISLPELAQILRDFLLSVHPQFEEMITPYFQIGNVSSIYLDTTFNDLKEKHHYPKIMIGSDLEELLPSLEVTLYEDWDIFCKKFKKRFSEKKKFFNFPFKNFSNYSTHLKDFGLLCSIILLIVVVIKEGNTFYEKYLAEKISIYEPEFKWGSKKIKFKADDEEVEQKDFKLDIDDIDKVANGNSTPKEFDEEERFDTESDVVISSWDALPKDFDAASLEQSDYEEMIKSGNRDTQSGNKKVYRVMMKSVDPPKTQEKLNGLINKYKVTQVDNVKPGLFVPGGVYYNVFVPREFLKDFLAQVVNIDEAILYETRTKRFNPPGKNRVFIWIKSM